MTTPTLLIPGLNGSARFFDAQIPLLWRHGPVMVADHRHADSVAGLAEQILASAPPRFRLAGFSLGGFIAFEILRRCPERVAGLALLSTNAIASHASAAQVAVREQRIAMARNGRFSELSPLHFPVNVHASRENDPVLRALHRAMTDDVGPAGYVNQQLAIAHRPDSRATLPTIACPTLIVCGNGDKLTPLERSQEMHAAIRGSELVVLDGCGHLSPVEAPAAVGTALERWAARTRTGRSATGTTPG